MIRVLLLDVDNTLMDFHECARQAMHITAAEQEISFPANIFEIFTEINNGLWLEIEKGTLTVEQLHQVRWNRIFEAIGIKRDGVAFEQGFLKNLAQGDATVEGAQELLAYLAPKYTLCVASNAPYFQQTSRLKNAGLLDYFEKLFISETIGFSKPKKEFFYACMKELPGVKKEEIMMIGDSLTADIAGASAYGLATCWFNFGKAPREKGAAADHIVDSLDEIQEIL